MADVEQRRPAERAAGLARVALPAVARARAAPTGRARSPVACSSASARARRPPVAARTNARLGLRSNVRQWRDARDRDHEATAAPTSSSSATSPSRRRARASCSSRSRRSASTTATSTSARAAAPRTAAPVPLIVGAEGAGTVLRGAGEFAEGDRVAWVAAPGSYAERVVVPVAQAVPLPDGDAVRPRRRGAAAGHDRALPLPRRPTRCSAGDDVRRARGGRRRRAAAHADGQGARRARDRHDVDRGEGGAGARRGRRRDDRLRGLRGAGARAHRRRGRARWSTTRSARRRSRTASTRCARAGCMVLYGRPAARRRPTTRSACRPARSTSRAPACRPTSPRARSCCERAGDVLGWVADGSLDVRIGERYPLEDAAPRARGPRGASHDRKAVADSLTDVSGDLGALLWVHDDVTPQSGLGQPRTSGTFARHV